MSDAPLGGIFDRFRDPDELFEAYTDKQRDHSEKQCVKKILRYAAGDRGVAWLNEQTRNEPLFTLETFMSLFPDFPVVLKYVRLEGLRWHLNDLWGSAFAKHPLVAEYFNVLAKQPRDDPRAVALLATVHGFSGSSVFAIHNMLVDWNTSGLVANHTGGEHRSLRLTRYYRDNMITIEDMLSMMELIGRQWCDLVY